MPYISTAPSVIETVAESISYHRGATGSRYYSEYGTDRLTVGQFTAAAGATVEVRAIVQYGKERPSRNGRTVYGEPEYRVIQFGASVTCHGYGCADSTHEEPLAAAVPLDSEKYAEELAEGAEPAVQKAREWAQAHAEKCRAQAYK
ncbi:hypothetical protein AB0G60_02775 [Streptomyces angustmyceticus]|uniref:Uncharacterized protein n=1 Tax=Streptomyces angustmyceticus TaxID=285578 RepID=A0A5J4L1A3_9ACTN|nr:hypothetical protein [Streptomyces angustmyceticus]UAL65587.1 hypothetical protein K7396_02750 [Streptomyces angustmyceticus]GES27893.1 hypothetical protein San01_03800 [Streptomyces angustmyceticus]